MAAINMQIPDDLKAAIDAQAAAEMRTLKAVVIRALEQYLAAAERAA